MRLLPLRICLPTKLGFHLPRLPKGGEWQLLPLLLPVSPSCCRDTVTPYGVCPVTLTYAGWQTETPGIPTAGSKQGLTFSVRCEYRRRYFVLLRLVVFSVYTNIPKEHTASIISSACIECMHA